MLAENFPDLEKLYGQGALSGYLGGQQLDAARKSQQINQQGALQEMYWKDQTTPVDMQYKKALSGQADATARGQNFTNDMNDATKDEQYKAKVSDLAKKISDNELEQSRTTIQQMALHPDPKIRQLGEQYMRFFKEVVTERQKGLDSEAIAKRTRAEQHSYNKELEQMRIDAGKYTKRGSNAVSFVENLYKLKKAHEKYAALNTEAKKAELEGDLELAAKYRAMMADLEPQARVELAAMPKPGAVDVSSAAPNLRVNPSPQISPPTTADRLRQTVREASGVSIDKASVEAEFGSFEPDKYEYRKGPKGNIQRRLKTQ